jgi:anti-sigma factor RsiW
MVELVTDYLEGSLPRRGRRRFEAHLSGCDHCSEYLRQIRTTVALTGRLTVDDLTPAQRGELVAVFRRWRSEYQ